MKKLHFYFLMICFISMSATFTSCEKDDEKDPIIGTWVNESSVTLNGQKFSNIMKWVFNEGNEGTYSFEQNGTIDVTLSFTWEKSGGLYLIDYDNAPEDLSDYTKVKVSNFLGQEIIETEDGVIVAIKE